MATNYTGNATPTLNNAPANSWATDAEKRSHVGNTYLVTGSGGTAGNVYAFEQFPSAVVKEVPASGLPAEIVTITDGGENIPMTSAEVSLSPIQSLNGYDSPWPAGGGKNLFYFNSNPSISPNGLTYTVVNENEVKITGTAVLQSNAYFWGYTNGGPGFYLKNGTYRITVEGAGGNSGPYIVYSGGGNNGVTYNTLTNAVPSQTITVTDDTKPFNYFVIRTDAGTTVDTTIKIQIESGSTATEWSPYSNICPISGHTGAELKIGATYPTAVNTYPVTFSDQGTVYGGKFDFVSGKLVIDHVLYADSGSAGWVRNANGSFYMLTSFASSAEQTADGCYCNYAPYVVSFTGMSVFVRPTNSTISLGSGWGEIYATADELKAAFAQNPLQIVYKLASPLEYTLSAQQIETLLGENNVWSDAGEISKLVYRSNQYVMAYDWFETWTMPKITRNNGNVIVLPYPKEYTPDIYDVDASTTGRNAAGTMIRDRVAVKHKFNYKFPPLSQADATEILNAVRDSSFTLTTASPETGAKTNYRVYVGDRSLPVYWMPNHNQNSWLYETLTLNLIEM